MILFSDPVARRKECGNANQTPEELITREVTLYKLYWSSVVTIGSPKITLNIISEIFSPSLAGWISCVCHPKNSYTFTSFLIWSKRRFRYNLFDLIILIIGLIDWLIYWVIEIWNSSTFLLYKVRYVCARIEQCCRYLLLSRIKKNWFPLLDRRWSSKCLVFHW